MKLAGKTVLITGAAKRIGREIALTLAQCGANIIVHFNHSETHALKVKKEIESFGVQATLIGADFSARAKPLTSILRTMTKEIYRKVRRIDVLVNNASIFYPTPFGKINEKDWDNFLTVNLKAPFFLAQEIGLRMVRQKSGKIINLVDWTALRPYTDYLPYAVSKAGLMAVTTGLAKILAPHVQVNSIAPGPILPPPRGMTNERKQRVTQKTLLKRFGRPEDIAQTVRFLIEDTDFVTGAFIPVDGGSLVA